MTKLFITLCTALALSGPLHAQANAEASANSVFDTFLEAMANADVDTVISLFAEDALFWGTGSRTLVTDPAGVLAYFGPVGNNEPGANVVRARDYETVALANDLVMMSGVWEILPGGEDDAIPLRVSMLIALRNGQWKIIQFHNSSVPN